MIRRSILVLLVSLFCLGFTGCPGVDDNTTLSEASDMFDVFTEGMSGDVIDAIKEGFSQYEEGRIVEGEDKNGTIRWKSEAIVKPLADENVEVTVELTYDNFEADGITLNGTADVKLKGIYRPLSVLYKLPLLTEMVINGTFAATGTVNADLELDIVMDISPIQFTGKVNGFDVFKVLTN